jgi:hypothetical protein
VTSDGTLSSTQPTTLDGIATTNLTSATFAVVATVTCSSGTGSGSVKVTFVESNTGDVASIRVIPNPLTIKVGGQTSTITISVENASGNGIPGEDVFISVSGPSGTTIVPDEALTDANGRVVATLRSGTGSGTASISADAGALTGNGIVTILAEAPQTINLTAPDAILEGNNATVTADIRDAFNNPVRDGTSLTFSLVSCTGASGACTGVRLSQTNGFTVNGLATTIISVDAGTQVNTFQVRANTSPASPATSNTINVVRGPSPTPTSTPVNTPIFTATPLPTSTPLPTATLTPTP